MPDIMHVWCGFGGSTTTARSRLAAVMEAFYRTPFGKFERYCPCGTPAEVAAGLRPYLDAGCRSFNLIPVADSEQAPNERASRRRHSAPSHGQIDAMGRSTH